MSMIERYILRIAAVAFFACLFALTAIIWLSQALRELNLVTGKGQTILLFLEVTMLSVPALVMIIAPLALFIAVLYTLNRLNSDSELIVMNAAGLSPMTILRPFAMLTVVVTLIVGSITLFAMPESFRALRTLISKVRADVVTRILQEGKFIELERGITFHYRERLPGGAMGGVMIHDSRDPKLAAAYLAERGQVVEVDGATYLVLEKGSMQRQESGARGSTLIGFERYVFDLDQFEQGRGPIQYKPRERRTIELLTLDRNDPYVRSIYGRFRSELHDRLTNPLYPLATLAIAFAALGSARTTRQGRGQAIVGAVVALVVMRIAGFAAASFAVRSAAGVPLMYAVPLLATAIAGFMAWRSFWPQRRRFLPEFDRARIPGAILLRLPFRRRVAG
ncbi:MAG: LPS export ABC transporter permease LptF [Methylobacterium sp.]|jgi:lipopolysaccharide export system permease protein|nr:LPS export ABC transporter permease LptF [Methylobacterium sp.]MCA3600095.1 LPS export ABC transporter permease LptF [Methylobacterium sp.]MCA3607543.1 LPS export ABC transporter permease LptF [Methylobacterium sp.]MCA3609493.1 LPS export ABC transporter permease LptF [Methylobacterium sp.]MCA3611736.1 LPS export ABC transporter permease LptF [Methylobacterium sp.]